VAGDNGWYLSAVDVSGSASDPAAGSGLAAFLYAADGSAWVDYTSAFTLSGDGTHSATLRAVDAAGNSTDAEQNIQIDSTLPELNLSAPASFCPACAAVEIAYSAGDATSGVAGWVLSADGTPLLSGSGAADDIFSWDDAGLSAGGHTLNLKVVDVAGNEAETEADIEVLLPAPTPTMTPTGTLTPTATATRRPDDPSETPAGSSIFSIFFPPTATFTLSPTISPTPSPTRTPKATSTSRAVVSVGFIAAPAAIAEALPTQPESFPAPVFDAAAIAAVAGVTAYWAGKKRAEEEARQAAEAAQRAAEAAAEAASARRRRTARQRRLSPLEAAAEKLKEVIAAVTHREEKEWKAERYAQISQSDEYRESDNKSQFMKQELENIKAQEAAYREKQQEEQRADEAARQAAEALALAESQLPPMPPGLSPEAQAAWLHSGAAAHWAANNAGDLQAQYAATLAAQQAAAAETPGKGSGLAAPDNKEPGTSWLSNIPFVGQQLDNAWQALAANVTPQNVVSSALALTMGVTGVQWATNVFNTPNLFASAQENMQAQLQQVLVEFPGFIDHPKDQSLLDYVWSDPYRAVGASSAAAKAIINSVAGYADAVWQQSPVAQIAASALQTVGDTLCPNISDQGWQNRCYGVSYGAASLVTQPADTLAGVVNGFLVDPAAGLGKVIAFGLQNNPIQITADLIHSAVEDGWSGITDYAGQHLEKLGELISDGQVQSFGLTTLFTLAGIFVAPAAVASGLALLGLQGLSIDQLIASAPTKEFAINIATSQGVRTFAVSAGLLLGLLALGGVGKVSEFTSFQDGMSLSAQSAFADLSIIEQTRLFDMASKLNISPEAMDFYLDHINAGDARLANIPLADALSISALAEQSGEGAFLLDYITQYGSDPSVLTTWQNVSPEGLQFYVEQAKTPGSILSSLTPQQGITLSELSPASIARITGITAPTIPDGVVPDINTPVLGLTSQELSALTELSAQNPNAEYAVLGLWNNGQGYTMVGSEGYTYLDMPESIYQSFFKDFPGDFRLVNKQFLINNLVEQDKPIVLETPWDTLKNLNGTSAFWEVDQLLADYNYSLKMGEGPNGYDVLVPEQ
jgi:hypothetical protein